MDYVLLIAAVVLVGALVATTYRWLSLRTGVNAVLRVKEEREARETAERSTGALRSKVDELEHELGRLKKEVVRLEEVGQVRKEAEAHLPRDGKVLVVSRGDPQLLDLGGRDAQHFPQTEAGLYAGYYPETSAEAIQHLEELRSRGARFLIFPSTSFWWLDHYEDFRRHLESRCGLIARSEDSCAIFDLDGS
jgi:transposase-like protein